LRTELANIRAQNTRFARRITILETRVSEASGTRPTTPLVLVPQMKQVIYADKSELERRTADLAAQLRGPRRQAQRRDVILTDEMHFETSLVTRSTAGPGPIARRPKAKRRGFTAH
jgi:hypothetical protein